LAILEPVKVSFNQLIEFSGAVTMCTLFLLMTHAHVYCTRPQKCCTI